MKKTRRNFLEIIQTILEKLSENGWSLNITRLETSCYLNHKDCNQYLNIMKKFGWIYESEKEKEI